MLDSALPHLPVGSLTLTVHDAELADSAQLSSITAGSAVVTSEKRIGWLRRTASMRAFCRPLWIDSAVARICMLAIQAAAEGAISASSRANTTSVTDSSISVKPSQALPSGAGARRRAGVRRRSAAVIGGTRRRLISTRCRGPASTTWPPCCP